MTDAWRRSRSARRSATMATASLASWVRSGSPGRRLLRVGGLLASLSVLLPLTVAAVVLATYLYLPLPPALPDERPQVESMISTVYAIDGTPIGQFREAEQAIPVEADEIPDTIRRAVVAVEDHDFFLHEGIDYRAVARAFVHNLSAGRIVEGGSTITQQLVKNLYTGKERSVLRKLREAVLAAQLERQWSKEEILARYLNTVYLGDSTFGVEAASRSYFRKPAKDLTLSEAALLAGLIPAPSLYSPRSNPKGAEARRRFVLDKLLEHGLASPQEVAAARAEKPTIHPPPGVEGRYPYFLDYVWEYLTKVQGLEPAEILRGGLRIETTLDPALQDHAERVVAQTLPDPDDPDAALVALEPRTGFVRALVGGKDWAVSQVNLALGPDLGPGTGRQAGSAFKPFVMARALEAGVSPDKVYPAPACVTPRGFTKPVCNYGRSGYGALTLRRALHRSVNTVFVQLVVDVGIEETARLAARMGIKSFDFDQPIYGGIAIGTQEVSPLDMASAFGVWAARGMRAEPTPVLRVLDREGNVVVDNTRPRLRRVMRTVVADTMNALLTGVITSGTGRAANIGRPAAGKTGTSQNFENAWFVGYTPTLSTAVWMGFRQGNIPMHNVHGVGAVAGGTIPARMWAAFMRQALEGVPKTKFTEPAPLDSLQELARRRQRRGIELGPRRYPSVFADGGPYYEDLPRPHAGPPPTVAPSTTTTFGPPPETTTTVPPETTTTTTDLGPPI